MDRLADMKQTLENDVLNPTHATTAQDEESKWQALERKIKYERLNDAELGAIWEALSEVVGTQQSGVTLAVLYGTLVSVLQQQVAALSSNADQEAASSSSDEDEDAELEDDYEVPRPRRDRRSKAQRRAHKFTHQDMQAHKAPAEERIQRANELRRVEAGCKLLYIVCLQLSAATLRQSTVFEQSVALCMALIDKRAGHGVYQHVLKNLIRTARAQSTSTWSQNTMAQLIRLLMARALEDDASMRNKVHKTLQAWLEAPLESAPLSVVQWREAVSKPIVAQLVLLAAQSQRATLVRVSELIGAVLPLLSESGVKRMSDVLLKLTQRADPELSVAAFDQLHHYCAQLTQPQPLVVQFINALYELQPNKNDVELSLHYVQVLGSAYQALCITDRALWTSKLPRLLATTLAYLQTDTFDLHRVATLSLQNVLYQGCARIKQLPPAEIEAWLCGEDFTSALDKMVQSLHTSLKVIYQHAWSKIVALLHTLARALAELLPLACPAEPSLAAQQEGYFYLLRDLCAQVLDLHSLHAKETAQDDDHVTMALTRAQPLGRAQRMSRREQDELDEEIELLLTPLVSLLGIARYLTAIQFALPPTHTPRHCWLLPILRRRVAAGASLLYYHNVFVKQTALLYTAALAAQPAQQQTLLQLYKQSWALLPSFALESRDVVAAFPQLSAVLLDTLGEKQVRRVDIRPAVVQCLTILAHRAHREQLAANTATARALAPHSAQVLSALFNSFVADTTSQAMGALRNQLVQAIAAWLQIAEQPLVQQIFKSVMAKFLAATATRAESAEQQAEVQSLLELLVPFIAYLPGEAELGVVYQAIAPLLHSKHHGIEKKAFKALMTQCEHHGGWVSAQLWTVHRALVSTLDSSAASSKAMRLRTVLHVITHLGTTQLALEFLLGNNPDKSAAKLGNLMPEVTLALKETSAKVRGAAEKIFDLMFVKMIELHDSSATTMTQSSTQHVAQFMKHLIALLAARHAMMISAALSAFRILFKYMINLYKLRRRGAESEQFVLFLDAGADTMSDGSAANPFAQQISAVPKMVVSVLESPYKEVVASALEVIKTLSTKSIADTTLLRPHLEYLLKTIFTGMTADNRDHFRAKIKIILERLIAKFGYDTIEPFVPRKHRKLIVNIRKTLGRLDKKKKQKQEEYQKRVKEQRAAAQDAAVMDSSADHVPAPSVAEDEDLAKRLLKSESAAPHKRASQYETQLRDTLERRRRYKEQQTSASTGEKSMWILEGRSTAPGPKQRTARSEEEDEDEEMGEERVIDFLDPNANQYIVSTNPHKFTGRREKQTDFETTEDGRMIIKDEDEDAEDARAAKQSGLNKKRKRGDEDEDEDEQIHANNNNAKLRKGPAVKKQKLNAAGQVGEMYASKYAAGDMKKPGRPDPYAYIKLDPKFLNKRRRHVAHQQFENIVKGAKKGAKTKPKRR